MSTYSDIASDSDDEYNAGEPFDLQEALQRNEAQYQESVRRIEAKYRRPKVIENNRASRAAVASGSIPAPVKRITIDRRRGEGETRLMNDYFNDPCIYTDAQFRRRFRMRRSLFLRILEGVISWDPGFNTTVDAVGKQSFSGIHKLTAVIWFLATGLGADALDDRTRMAPSTLLGFVDRFLDAIHGVFGEQYMRKPNDADFHLLMRQAEGRGFPGMLGSIDCMHWTWKNCPVGWAGQYTNAHHGKPSIVLEAVAGPDTWIWHSFFGVSGANNDLNVLQRSPVLNDMFNDTGPQYTYHINGRQYNRPYYLGDGIYPSWTCFVKSMKQPMNEAQQMFKSKVDNYRKDIERTFGILQARWHIIANPAKGMSIERLCKTMNACIIMHNMIVEDERDTYRGIRSLRSMMAEYDHEDDDWIPAYERQAINGDEHFHLTNSEIKNRAAHIQLQEDLVQHVWAKFGNHQTFDNESD